MSYTLYWNFGYIVTFFDIFPPLKTRLNLWSRSKTNRKMMDQADDHEVWLIRFLTLTHNYDYPKEFIDPVQLSSICIYS